MQVRNFCYYLTEWGNITPRQQDWNSVKVVRCLKGKAVKGYFDILIGGVQLRVEENNKGEFLRRLWTGIGDILADALQEQHALVPVPNSPAILGTDLEYRTLSFARQIAVASKGKVVAADSLRWRAAEDALHSRAGARSPGPRYDNLVVVDCPKIPIILFDDVITSGSSFIAACWRLEEAGNRPKEGVVVARRTVVQEENMFAPETRELDIPPRPFF